VAIARGPNAKTCKRDLGVDVLIPARTNPDIYQDVVGLAEGQLLSFQAVPPPFSALRWAWDSIHFGGRPAALLGAGDSAATLCPSMGMALEIMGLFMARVIKAPRRRTRILCTCMAERDASPLGMHVGLPVPPGMVLFGVLFPTLLRAHARVLWPPCPAAFAARDGSARSKSSRKRLPAGSYFRRCRHSLRLRPSRLLALLVAPAQLHAARALSLELAWDSFPLPKGSQLPG
jgi:hypothetical protein